MADDDAHLLLHSLRDEREFVLRPRIARLEEALKQILALSGDPAHPAKLRALVDIHRIAAAALTL